MVTIIMKELVLKNIISKMNVLPFNSNENNEKDPYPTISDYIDTIYYNLGHGWVPDVNIFSSNEIEIIISIEDEYRQIDLREEIYK